MRARAQIRQDDFDSLLRWLDVDVDAAGRKYESIRERLIRIFFARQCTIAEELADETIDRVTRKGAEFFNSYDGDPASYFYGVAKNVYLEFTRKPKSEELPPALSARAASSDDSAVEENLKCLDKCLATLGAEQRDLIVEYYRGERSAKINARRRLAERAGITAEALRVRALRLRLSLQKCVFRCLGESQA